MVYRIQRYEDEAGSDNKILYNAVDRNPVLGESSCTEEIKIGLELLHVYKRGIFGDSY